MSSGLRMSVKRCSALFRYDLSLKLRSTATCMLAKRNCSNYNLSEQHRQVQRTCYEFAENILKPIAAELDREQRFPSQQITQLGKLGYLGINVSPEYGGSGHDTLATAVAVEEISRGCASTGSIVSIHNCLYASLLDTFGNNDQKNEFLKPILQAASLGCFALSEPDAGSDVGAMSTSAKPLDGDTYVLNGIKSWVTSGPVGKVAVVFATIDPKLKHKGITAFIVPMDSPGVTLGRLDNKLGIRAVPTCNVMLNDVVVARKNVLGESGEGFRIAMSQLDKARIGIAAQALGIGQAALELAVRYARQRRAFGKPISEMQAVKLRIADMALRLESARLLVHRAAVLCDGPTRSTKESSMAKLAASEAATKIAHSAIQVLGGMGYVAEMPAERHYRDARITEIYGGISDIQRLLIGELVIDQYK